MHVDCPACDAGLASPATRESAQLSLQKFRDAWPAWLAERRRIAVTTRETYRQYFLPLDRFFGDMQLNQIGHADLTRYQKERLEAIKAERTRRRWAPSPSAGASRINHEVAALGRVLNQAGLWEPLKRFYEPMPLPREGPGIALTDEEENHLFEVARQERRWLVAFCCDLISVGTTAGPGEIRHLQIRNIDLEKKLLHIEEGTKNRFRVRPVPLEGDAEWAIRTLLERYKAAMAKAGIPECGDHYLLYHRAHRRGAPPDPTRPMGSWKRAHYSMRAEAGKKFPRLLKVRRYDFRHTGATKMLEDPEISYSTIERMMGHRLGSRTKQRYDHVRDATLRRAARLLDGGHTGAAAGITEMRKPPETAQDEPPKSRLNKGF